MYEIFDAMAHPHNLDLTLFFVRFLLGLFFAISGFHKLFNATRHAQFVMTLKANGVYNHFTEWAVCTVEFSAGCALMLGLLTPLAAFGLLVIISVAIITDGMARINAMTPIDGADAVCCFLYLPEVMYAIMLVALINMGAGSLSLDNGVSSYLHQQQVACADRCRLIE